MDVKTLVVVAAAAIVGWHARPDREPRFLGPARLAAVALIVRYALPSSFNLSEPTAAFWLVGCGIVTGGLLGLGTWIDGRVKPHPRFAALVALVGAGLNLWIVAWSWV